MQTFTDYLSHHYTVVMTQNRIEYCFQNIPQSLVNYHANLSKERKVFWTPQTLGVISHNIELVEEKIQEIKNEVSCIKKNTRNPLCTFEEVPTWYFNFIRKFYGLNVFRGSIVLSSSVSQDTMCIKPTCLNGQFFIGQYAGITPISCPIFTNDKGEIFVYSAENFRNYPQTSSSKDIKRYLKQDVSLIACWENIDAFLIDECERLQKMFIDNPSVYSIKNCAPNKKAF